MSAERSAVERGFLHEWMKAPDGEPTRHEWMRVCVYHHVEHPDPRQVRDWLSNDNELNLSWTCGCVLQVRKVMPVG